MLKTNLNKPILKRKDLHRVVAIICVFAMLINPLTTGISYANNAQEENPYTTLTSIQEEEPETPVKADPEEEQKAPVEADPEEGEETPAETDLEEGQEVPVETDLEEEQEAPVKEETKEDSPKFEAKPSSTFLPGSSEGEEPAEMSPFSTLEKPDIELNTSEWSDNVVVTINGTAPEGGAIQYRVDSQDSWENYTSPVNMTEEGEHTVYARVVDGEGAESDTAETVYKLDTTPPEISVSCAADGDATIATVTVSDPYSGVAIKKYAEGIQTADYFATQGTEFETTFPGIAGAAYTVFAEDASGNSDILTFTMNTAPTLSGLPDKLKMKVNTEVSFSFTVNDDEMPGEALSVEVTADNTDLFPDPFVVTNTGGSCTAKSMPAPDLSGSAVVTVTVSDGTLTASETINIAPNAVPNAADDTATVDENDSVAIEVLVNDTDEDDDELTIVSVIGAVYGVVEISPDEKSVVYTPTPGWNGADSFTYTISDTSDATAAATVFVTVVPVTEGPQIILSTTEWSNNVLVTLTGTVPPDGSIQYRVDDGDWQTYTEPVQMTEEGSRTLYARIVNGAGIPTRVTSAVYKLDRSGPSITALGNWDGSTSQEITVEVTDNYTAVSVKKYAQGEQTADYFEENGVSFTDTITAEKGVWYTLYAKDSCGNTTVERFTINTQPEISHIEDTVYGTEDNALSFTFTVSDAETNPEELSVSITADDTGLFPDVFVVTNTAGNCVVSSMPAPDQFGSSLLTITVFDGKWSREKTITAYITPENDAPVAVDDDAETEEDTPVTINVLANDTDADGDEVEILSVTTPGNGTAVISGDKKTILYTPAENYNGTDTFEYTIQEDSSPATSTAMVTVAVIPVNDAPVAVDDSAETNKNISIAIDVLDNDSDVDGDDIIITDIPEMHHGTVTIAEAGTSLIYEPEAKWHGTDTFTYMIEDAHGATATAVVTVKVNYADYPPAVSGLQESYDVNEDESIDIHFTLTDIETDDQSITAQVTSSDTSIIKNEKITVTGLGDADPGISLHIVPEPNQYGTVTITIKASDGFNIAEYTFIINVLPVNDAPVARNDSFTFTEDHPVTFTASQLLANDTDIDNTELFFGGVETGVQKGELQYNTETGVFTYTPEPNAHTNVFFTYRVSDGELVSGNIATVTLVCVPVNDEPWITEIADQQTLEDTTLSNIQFQIGDHETDAAQLILTMGSSDQSVVNDDKISVSGAGADKVLTIVPNTNGNGETTVSITVSDGEYYITKSFKLTVTAVQDPPTALDDVAVVRISESVIIPVLDNDFDVDGDTIALASVTAPSHGSIVSYTYGAITYKAHESYVGIDSFSYTIHDNNGNEDTAEVKVSCSDNKHVPILSSIPNQSINEDGTTGELSFNAFDLVDLSSLVMTKKSSDDDQRLIDDDGIVIRKVSDSTYTVSVTPLANQFGRSTITITATDSQGNSYSMSFLVIVHPVNDLPVAMDDTVTTSEDEQVQFNVLANDSDLESSVSVLSMDNAENGELTYLGGGEYRYIPDPDWNGTETLSYVIMDKDAATATATVTIQVTPVNDPPVARNDYLFNVDFNSSITINVLNNDYDIDAGSSISIHSCSHPDAVVNGDGTITFPANPGFTEAEDTYTYTIMDNEGATASALITLTREDAGSGGGGFYLYEASRTIREDSAAIEIDLSEMIDNYTGGLLTVGLSSESGEIPALGTTSLNGNVVRYTPHPNLHGTDTFYYTATNNDGSETKRQKITIHILPVNDAPELTGVSDITVYEDESIPMVINVEVTISDVDNPVADLIFAAGSSNQSVISGDEITIIKEADGKITLRFSPAEHANGNTTIIMKVGDGLAFAEKSFVIHIIPVNDLPAAADITETLDEDTSIYINLIDSQTDPDIDDALSAALVSGPSHGTVTIDADGIAHYTPSPDYNGPDSFMYKVTDSQDGEHTGTVTLTVNPVYDPTAILNLPASVTTTKDRAGTVPFDIPNPDNVEITVSLESQNLNLVDTTAAGSVSIYKDGTHYTATITPVANASGNALIVVKADDGTQEYTAVFTFYVTTAVGDVRANDDFYTIDEDTATVFNVIENDTDAENDPLSVISYTNPQHGSVVNHMNGTLTYKPVLNYNGDDSFQYTVTDPYGNTDQATVFITVYPVNDPPTARNDSITIEEDTSFSLNVLTNDSDVEGDPITLIGITQPSHGTATFNATTGEVFYTPVTDYNGSDSFTYTISDGKLTSTATVYVTVTAWNDPPDIFEVSPNDPWIWEMYEDTPASFSVRISDAETASNNLLVKITSTEKNLIADSNIKVTRSGDNYNIRLAPSLNQYGSLELEIMANDGVNTMTQPVQVIIHPVNDMPSFSVNTVKTVNEDSGNQSVVNWAYNISAGVANESEQVLTFIIVDNNNESLFSVQPAISSNGTLTFTPAENANGEATVTVKLIDDGGIAHGGQDTSEEKTFQIVVDPVNDAPSFTKGADQTVDEDTPAVTVAGWATAISEGPADELGQTLSFLVSNDNNTLFSIQPAISSEGTLTYTLAEHANGEATVKVRLQDNGGTANGGVDTSGEQTFKITVNWVNDDPVANDDIVSTLEDTAKTIDVLANDTDVDLTREGDNLVIVTIDYDPAEINGILEKTDEGKTITYTPEANWHGTFTFTYTIKDKTSREATATVTVTVESVNDVSVANGDTATVNEDEAVEISVLANDSDIDRDVFDGSDVLTVKSATNGSNGMVAIIDGETKVRYTPKADWNGEDSFQYTVQDLHGGEATATVTVTVTPVEDDPVAADDAITIQEDAGATVINVLSNDKDADILLNEDAITIATIDYDPAEINGILEKTDEGKTITYTPEANWHGTFTFTYTIKDKTNREATATVTVTVESVNDVPVANGDTATVNEDEAVEISVLANDSDIDRDVFDGSDVLTVKSATNGSNGTVTIIDGETKVRYTPKADWNGEDSFQYTVQDLHGGEATATVTVTVTPVEDDPVAADDGITIQEDAGATVINVLSNDKDADILLNEDAITIATIDYDPAEINGILEKTDEGKTITYTPEANWHGTFTFTYTIKDKTNREATATVMVTVESVNDVPVANGDTATVNEDEAVEISVLANDSDIDRDVFDSSDALTVKSATNGSNGTVTIIDGETKVRYTPKADWNGEDSFQYTVQDLHGGEATATVTVTVTPVEDDPVAADDAITIQEDAGATVINVLSNDKDADILLNEDAITIATIDYDPAEINGILEKTDEGKTITYTPEANWHGTFTFTYTIKDKTNREATATVTVTVESVNDVPVANGDTATVNEDEAVEISVLANDSDIDRDVFDGSDVLTVKSATNGSNGTVAIIDGETKVRYTPKADWNGEDSFQYTVQDLHGGEATATVTVTVTPVEDDPVAADDAITIQEDAGATVINVLSNDKDADILLNEDAITIATIDYDPAEINGILEKTDEGKTITYTPEANWHGTFTFTYTIKDKTNREATATVTVTVESVNDAPEITGGTEASGNEDDAAITGTVTATDIDGDTLTFEKTSEPENGTVTFNSDGSYSYKPDLNWHGTDTFDVKVSDGNGGEDTATVTITVHPVNDAPEITGGTEASGNEDDAAITGTVTATDIDGDDLTFEKTSEPENGTVTFNSDGSYSYKPNLNWHGTDTFDVKVSDGNGGEDTATVTITVHPVNDVPVANGDTATVNEDEAVEISVLANDSDIDRDVFDGSDVLTVKSATNGSNGTVTIIDGETKVRYTPKADWNGEDSFQYTVQDLHGGEATATVTVTVTPVEDDPVAADDAITIQEDAGATVINVLSNDKDADILLNEDAITIATIDYDPAEINGILEKTDEGKTVTYTPEANWHGAFTFTYTIKDKTNREATATVTVTVESVNDAPEITGGTETSGNEDDAAITGTVTATDIDGDDLSFETTNEPENGTITFNSDGSYSYKPNPNWHGTDTFNVKVSDGNGGEDTATVTITVNPVNDAPEITGGTEASGNEDDTAITGTVTATDIDGDDLSFEKTSEPINGTVTFNLDGSYSYTPNPNWHGTDTFNVKVSDGNGGEDTATVTITVNPVNDAPEITGGTEASGNEDDTAITGTVTATDIDGDDLSFEKTSEPINGTVTFNLNGSYSYTPNPNWHGTDTFNVKVSDSNSGEDTATVTITVNPVNDAPEITGGTEASGNEDDAAITGTVTATDIDGDTLTFEKTSEPINGTVTFNLDGSYSYTPNPNWHGTDTFGVKVSDGNGGEDTATVTITVHPVNDVPTANGQDVSCNEDSSVNGQITGTDIDGDTLSYTKGSDPSHGSAVVNTDGSYTYTPEANYNGPDSFDVTVSDGNGGEVTVTVTVTVDPVNDAPEITGGTEASGNEDDTAITGMVTATDIDEDDLSFETTSEPRNGTVTFNSNGSYSYKPDLNWHGTDTFNVKVSDGNGGEDTATVTITVHPVNDAPEITGGTEASGNEDDTAITGTVTATDIDEDDLSFETTSEPRNGTVTFNSNGSYSYTPNPNWHGTDTFNVKVSDGNGGEDTATVTITVHPVNDAPEITGGTEASGNEDDTAITGTVTATDIDEDDLSFETTSEPRNGTVTFNSNGSYSYTPNLNWHGTDTFDVKVSDGNGGEDTATVTITVHPVNDAPEITGGTEASGNEDDTAITGTVTATDIDEDDLSFETTSEPRNGTVTFNSNGSYSYMPNPNWHGTDTFNVKVSDGNGGEDTATVTITVHPVNDVPTANGQDVSCNEDSSVNGQITGTDIDGDTLSYTKWSDPSHGSVVVNTDGSYTYTPEANYNGPDSFDVTVSDGNGGEVTVTVTVTVDPVNDAPEITGGTEASGNEDDTAITGMVTATDVDEDDLSFETTSEPRNGTVTFNSNGSYSYTPDLNWHGTDTFNVKVSDGNGGEDTVTVTITVHPVNDAPEITGGTEASGNEDDTAITGMVTATDIDEDDLSFETISEPRNGTVTFNSNGSYSYTPDLNWHGTDTFNVKVSDGNGGEDTVTVTITVHPVNDAPTANGQDVSCNEDSSVNGQITGTDIDGDTLSYTKGSDPSHGSVVVNTDGSYTYTPEANYNGPDSFDVTVGDGNGGEDTATVTITVHPVNDAPEITGGTEASGNEDDIAITGMVTATDVDEDDLSFETTSEPRNGTVTFNSNGSYSYTPDLNWHGTDTFNVKVSDGNGGEDTATVTITVNPVNDAPVANDDTAIVNEDESILIYVLANDTDVDGDSLSIASVTQGVYGTVSIEIESGQQVVEYIPDTNWHGTDSFTYTVSDGKGGTDTATVVVTVNPVNDPPVITGGTTASGDADSIITGVATATDIDGDNLTFAKASDPNHGSVVVNPDGSYTYIPHPGYYGTDSFQITVDDGNGGTATATVAITVNEVTTVDLYGTITNKLTGDPVNNAKVELMDLAGNVLEEYITTGSGMYLFENLNENLYSIRVSHAAYSDNMRQIKIVYSNVVDGKVREDFEMSKFKITLVATPSAIVANGEEETVLTATIVDENNNPVSGVIVQFSADGNMGTFHGGTQALTGADGKASVTYRSVKIEAVYSMAVPVTAIVEDYAREIFASDQILVTFAPGRIKGIVTDSNNAPIEGAKVVVKHVDDSGKVDFIASFTTGSDGKYSFVIPRGGVEYQIEITKPFDISGSTVEKTFIQKITVGEVSGTGEEQFDSDRTVTGIIGIFDTDRQINLLTDKSGELTMEVRDSGGEMVTNAAVTINNEGIFNVTGLERGDYTLALRYTFPDGRQIVIKKVDVRVGMDGEISINEVLIDPYGTVTENSSSGPVIEGANVTLYYANTARNIANGLTPGAAVPLPAVLNFPPADNGNPHTTSASGQYAFMVFPQTDYYLVATKSGYKTFTSSIISVYEDIVQYDFSMIKETGGGGVTGGGGGSGGATGVVEAEEKDLAIVIYSDKMRVSQNGTVDFTLKYFNRSAVDVKDVIVTVEIPDEMKVASRGSGKIGTGKLEWSLGTLAAEAQGTLTFTLKASEIETGQQMVIIYSAISSSEDLVRKEDDTSKIQIMIYDKDFIGTHEWYILGYPDNEFKPHNNLTRAETAAIFSRLLHLNSTSQRGTSYLDVAPSHWAYGYIEAMTHAGLMQGMGEGSFMPDRPITRAELAAMIARYLDLERSSEIKPVESHFNDISQSWAQSMIEEIYRYRIVEGYEDGSFKPNSTLKRDEAVTFINRALYRGPIAVPTPSFPDVSPDYWAWGDIEESAQTHTYRINEVGNEILVEILQ